jgi:hypothetical protein
MLTKDKLAALLLSVSNVDKGLYLLLLDINLEFYDFFG